jgi:hypothetical protein
LSEPKLVHDDNNHHDNYLCVRKRCLSVYPQEHGLTGWEDDGEVASEYLCFCPGFSTYRLFDLRQVSSPLEPCSYVNLKS